MSDKNEKIEQLLSRNVEEVIEKAHLRAALAGGKKLRVKFGIDPTGGKIHIGRAVALWKLREFQDLGHKIVLIIGDFTAQVGDPSDKLEKRPFLSKAQVTENLKNYLPQIGKILDLKKAEVRYNSEWLAKLNLREISELAEIFTFQQILERRNFRDRWEKHQEISYREGMYPLMQGYDSVAVKADVELGGTDQLFNLMAGRKIQERYGQKPQDVFITQMLLGLDGRKMSTSWGNVINIADEPQDQYGKIMSLHDDQIINYFRFATDASEAEIKTYEKALAKGENPKHIKEALAFRVVARYHGEPAAKKAGEKFTSLFSKKEISGDLPPLKIFASGVSASGNADPQRITAIEIIMASGAVKSKSEARRLIEQGGFELNEKIIKDFQRALTLRGGETVKVGKRRFFRIIV